MTAIISAACAAYVVQAGDRLTTRSIAGRYAGAHDSAANKMVIYMARDAVCSVGYTGQAYIGKTPTDEWLARQLWGGAFKEGPEDEIATYAFARSPNKWQVARARWELAKAINTEPQINSVLEITMAGWRNRRGVAIPFSASFGRIPTAHTNKDVEMRPWPRDRRFRVDGIGSLPSTQSVQAVFREKIAAAGNLGMEVSADALATIIKNHAQTTPTVGSDLMLALIPHPAEQRIVVRFLPGREHTVFVGGPGNMRSLRASFTPWIITPYSYSPPTVSTAQGQGGELNVGGWRIELEGPEASSAPRGGLLFATSTQARMPPPR